MELIFLDEQTLKVIDHAYATDDYEIIVDSLLPQKSSFTINKQSLKAEIGDLLLVKNNHYFYLGFIISIELDSKKRVKVKTNDYLSLLDVEVPIPTSYSGNVANFVANLIRENFISSGDTFQNVSYLEVAVETVKTTSLVYETDKMANILDLVEEFSKEYGIGLAYEVVIKNGKFHKVKIRIVEANVGLTIKSDLGTISDLVINDTNEISLNKIVFVPKAENSAHRSRATYFLTTDGDVLTSPSQDKRFTKVKVKYAFFDDNEYSSLLEKAKKELIDSSLEHSITFNFSFVANKIASIENLKCGAIVRFVTEKKTYETIVTKMEFKGSFNIAKVTLGEYRLSLTDKLKLFDRRK